MWIPFAFANMLTLAALRLIQKPIYSKTKLNPFNINWKLLFPSLPIFVFLISLNWSKIQHLSLSFWLITAIVVIGYYPSANFLYFRAVKKNELSSILPFLGLIPILTLVFGSILLRQHITILGTLGIIFIGCSIYVLQLNKSSTWYTPFTKLVKTMSEIEMILVSLITAIAAIGDKFAISKSSTIIYASFNTIGAFLVLFTFDKIYTSKNKVNESISKDIFNKKALFIMATLLISTQILGFAALKYAPVSGYPIGIRNLNIVVTGILAILVLKEKVTRYKIISFCLSAIGVLLVTK